MVQQVKAYGQILQFPDGMSEADMAEAISSNEHVLNPDYKPPLSDKLNALAKEHLGVDSTDVARTFTSSPSIADQAEASAIEGENTTARQVAGAPVRQSTYNKALLNPQGDVSGTGIKSRIANAANDDIKGQADQQELELLRTEAMKPSESGFTQSALNSAGRTIKGAGQIGSDFFDADKDNAITQYGQKLLDNNPLWVNKLEDIKDEPFLAFKEASGNSVPSMGAMVGVSAVGAGIASLAPLTGPAAPIVAAVGTVVQWLGPAAVAALPSYSGIRDAQILKDPKNESDAKSKAIAAIGASAVGAIEVAFGPQQWAIAMLTKEGRAAMARKFASTTIGEAAIKGGLKGALVEGSEEIVQNPIEQLASYEDPTSKENLLDTAFGGAMGAIGGSFPGAVTGAASQVSIAKLRPVADAPTLDDAIVAAHEAIRTEDPTLDDLKGAQQNETQTTIDTGQPQAAEVLTSAQAPLAGQPTEIVLPDNSSVKAQWKIVDADQLAASMKEDVNQPRDRTRAVSDVQIKSIANAPDYRRLSDSPVMDVGAPVVDQDGRIVAGNGRFAGLSQAYEQGTATEYMNQLREDAAPKGLSIEGIAKPVLVRQLSDPVDTRKMAIASNSGTTLQMSALEQAKLDAERMKGIENLDVNDLGDIALTPRNLTQLKDSLGSYVGTELGAMVDKGGQLSQEGMRRVRNAMLAKAYGSSPTLEKLVESTDTDMRNVLGALTKSANHIIKTKGDVKPLMEAVDTYSQLKARGNFLAQQDAFSEGLSKETEGILRFIDTNVRSQKKLTDFFKGNFVETDTTSDDMFSSPDTPQNTLRSVEPKTAGDNNVKQLEKHLKDNGYDFTVEPASVRDIDALDSTKKARKELAEKQAKLFKKKVVFVKADGPFRINGVMVPSIADTIFVDVRTDKAFDAIMAHELSHWMEQEKPAVYKELVKSLKTVIINEAEYAKKYGIEGATKAEITKEIVGDLMGDNFTEQSFWQKVAAANPEAFKDIAAAIIKWLKGVIVKAKSNCIGSEQWVKDATKAQDIIAKAVAQYTESDAAPVNAKSKPKFHKAFHGSPHDHNKFESSKIGTGEGAQAYGFGHYFAESKDVAEYYKKALSIKSVTIDNTLYTTDDSGMYRDDNGKLFKPSNIGEELAIRGLLYGATRTSDLNTLAEEVESFLQTRSGISTESIDKAKNFIKSGRLQIIDAGKLYEVELAPEQDEYLLWDRPLSEQSDKVKGALNGQLESLNTKTKRIGSMLYASANGKIGAEIPGGMNGQGLYSVLKMELGSDKKASGYLRSEGIRGIKYLDGSSRAKGEGAYNYVIFDDKDVSITAKFSRAPLRRWMPVPRKPGWTEEKILRALKSRVWNKASGKSAVLKAIAEFDSAEEFADHIYYHGTGSYVDKSLVPSITMSEAEAERSGGGGYGDRYWAISLSKSKEIASNFTAQSNYGTVYGVILRKGANVQTIPGIEDAADIEDHVVQLWNDGVDAVDIGGGEQELAVLNPAAIVRYENGESFAVFKKKNFEPLTTEQIEDIYVKSKEFTADERKNLEVPDVKFSRAPKLYSKLEQALEAANDKIFSTGPQVKLWLQSNAGKMGVKKDEIYWSGIDNWLDAQGKVSKQQVVEFVRNNGVKVEDVTLGGDKEFNAIRDKLDRMMLDELEDRPVDKAEQAALEKRLREVKNTEPKHNNDKLTLPGGTDYRELVVTVPTIEPHNAGDSTHFGDTGGGRSIGWLRMDTRDGGLFIEELQSQRAQQGRSKGFSSANGPVTEAERNEAKSYFGLSSSYWDSIDNAERDMFVLDMREREFKRNRHVPPAPFVSDSNNKATNAYITLLMKKALIEAVSNDHASVSWTTGDQQSERYDLSKQINMVSAISNNNGTYNLIVEDKSGNEIDPYSRSGKRVTPAEMEEVIGKDLTKKVVAGADLVKDKPWPKSASTNPAFYTVRGVDLKMGGEWAQSMYGNEQGLNLQGKPSLISQAANDIFKHVGSGKVESINGQPGFYVTPEMKIKDLPLFSRADNFNRWFGNSKVVDDQGNPKVVYHGTSRDITVFDPNEGKGKTYGTGSFFSSNRDTSATYTHGANGGNVMPVYLRMENPAVLDAQGANWNRLNKNTRVTLPPVTVSAQADEDLLAELEDRTAEQGVTRKLKARNTTLGRLLPDDFRYMDDYGSTDDIARWARQKGYDGLIINNVVDQGPTGNFANEKSSAPSTIYVAYNANQIKSAIGNNGDYSLTNNDIHFSKAITPPEETRLRRFQRMNQDSFNRFTVIKEWLAENGQALSDKADVHSAEERYHSMAANQLEDFREQQRNPLIEKIQKAGYTLGDIEVFLKMQHAQEANAQIRTLGDNPDATAYGIEDREAADYLVEAPEKLATLANEFRAITEQTKKLRLDAGILNTDITDAWEGAYKHYVPVKGEADSTRGVGKGLKTNFKSKRRLGHSLRDEHVIENILMDHERAILEVEKNRVGKHLVMMAAEMQRPDILSINQPEKRKVLKTDTAYTVEANGVVQGVFKSREEAKMFKQFYAASMPKVAPSAITINQTKDQRVIASASPMLAENEVNVYMNGHAIRVQIKDEWLARAYTKMGVEQFSDIVGAGRILNGYLSKVYTGYNPEFILTNMVRDFSSGTINLTGEQGFGMATKALTNYPRMFTDLLKYAATNGKSSTKWIDSYRANGGNTGAAYLSDMERLGNEVSTEYASYQGVLSNLKQGDTANAARAAGRKVFNATLKWIYNLNQAGENAMRLAAFKAMLDSGRTVNEAAKVAKNITVNFNRKGERQWTPALWLFYNASIQGTAATVHALFKGKHKGQAWALAGSMAAVGYMMAASFGGGSEDDWDEINDYTKERNMLIKSGGGYVKIPVPYGYGFFWNFGRHMAEAHRTGEWGKLPWHLATSAISELTPFNDVVVGSDEEFRSDQVFMGLLPTAMKIVAQPTFNKQLFTGSELMPESQFDKSQPDRQKMFRSTKGTMYDTVAGWLDAAGIDVSPEILKYITRTGTGGAGSLVDTGISAAMLKSQGAELDTQEIPFVRKGYMELGIKDKRAAYYKVREEARTAAEEFNRARRDNDVAKMQTVLKDKKELIALDRYANKLAATIDAARDQQDAVRADKNLSVQEKRLKLKDMEATEAKFYDQYLDVFKASKHR